MIDYKSIYDLIKGLKSLASEYHNDQMVEKLIEIQEAFFELREDHANLIDENRRLRERIHTLEDNSELEKDLILTSKGYYIRKSEQEQKKDIHYCAACWQKHKMLMPFVHSIGNVEQCCNCHTVCR